MKSMLPYLGGIEVRVDTKGKITSGAKGDETKNKKSDTSKHWFLFCLGS